MDRIRFFYSVVVLIMVQGQFLHAAKFSNQFAEFELPPQWQCGLEGAEWVCQSLDEKKKREALIVLAAKLAGAQDTLDQYSSFLKAEKSYNSVQGKPVKSEQKYVKYSSINGEPWVDSLHLSSEIPEFYTRYLATVKLDIGVLVTYSIQKDKYQQYLPDFEAMVKTLKVFRKQGPINVKPKEGGLFDAPIIPPKITAEVFSPPVESIPDTPSPKTSGGIPMHYLLLGVGVIAFILWKRKRQ